MSTQLIATLMLVIDGVFTGILCAFSIERVWIWAELDLRDYAIDFRRSMRRADIVQPLFLILTIALAIWFTTRISGSAETQAFVAIALLVLILVGSVVVLVPWQKQFRDRPEGEVPPDAETIRRRCRT